MTAQEIEQMFADLGYSNAAAPVTVGAAARVLARLGTIGVRRVERKPFVIEDDIEDDDEPQQKPPAPPAAKIKPRCEHDHLNEDGICRRCGADCRGIGPDVVTFVCPKCGATHQRGPVDGASTYRCLRCGETFREPLAPPAAPEAGKKHDDRWLCPYCFTLYAEYVNGCPRCHMGEVGTSTSVIRVEVRETPKGWIIGERRAIAAERAVAAGEARREALEEAAKYIELIHIDHLTRGSLAKTIRCLPPLDAAAAPAGEGSKT